VDANHRALPDAVLTSAAGARLSLRLLVMLRGGQGTLDCWNNRPTRRGSQAVRAARECGIPIPPSGAFSGQDLLRALEAVRMLADSEAAR
jgi:hypothetical protein